MCDAETKRLIKIETYKIIGTVALAWGLSLFGVIWWASGLDTRVGYLEEQSNKGERFTASQGKEMADAMYRLTESVGLLLIWKAEVQEHMANHDKNADKWIQQIERNTQLARENNLMLHKLLVRHEKLNHN